MPEGKPAGVRCAQLTSDNLCLIFDYPERPQVCNSYKPTLEYCGADSEDALRRLSELERMTGSMHALIERKAEESNHEK